MFTSKGISFGPDGQKWPKLVNIYNNLVKRKKHFVVLNHHFNYPNLFQWHISFFLSVYYNPESNKYEKNEKHHQIFLKKKKILLKIFFWLNFCKFWPFIFLDKIISFDNLVQNKMPLEVNIHASITKYFRGVSEMIIC